MFQHGFRSLTLAAAVILYASPCTSTEYRIQPLEWYVSIAKIIGTVRILKREPVEFEYQGERGTCGYTYEAEVVELLKGEQTDTFKIFGYGDDDGFVGINEIYFVMVFERDVDEEKKTLRATTADKPGLDEAKILCTIEGGSLVIIGIPQTMIPFDQQASAQFGGQWLGAVEYTPFQIPNLREETLALNGEVAVVTSWQDVKEVLQRMIRELP